MAENGGGEDVRIGEERHGCWGIDAPGFISSLNRMSFLFSILISDFISFIARTVTCHFRNYNRY